MMSMVVMMTMIVMMMMTMMMMMHFRVDWQQSHQYRISRYCCISFLGRGIEPQLAGLDQRHASFRSSYGASDIANNDNDDDDANDDDDDNSMSLNNNSNSIQSFYC